mmetsp:Transcript_111354/g.315227  ORF Transcript_111354/g.315227 Transcript_111354/m.315227 type:complete len:153 (-) Transcript_111354:206-664(-)
MTMMATPPLADPPTSGAQRPRPNFLKPAFDTTPAAPAPEVTVEMPEMPSTPMTQPSDSRPPSASGERSRALSQGYVKISEVESTKRLNDSLEKDNALVERQIADFLRLNLQLRDNITKMESALGVTHDEERGGTDDASAGLPGEEDEDDAGP